MSTNQEGNWSEYGLLCHLSASMRLFGRPAHSHAIPSCCLATCTHGWLVLHRVTGIKSPATGIQQRLGPSFTPFATCDFCPAPSDSWITSQFGSGLVKYAGPPAGTAAGQQKQQCCHGQALKQSAPPLLTKLCLAAWLSASAAACCPQLRWTDRAQANSSSQAGRQWLRAPRTQRCMPPQATPLAFSAASGVAMRTSLVP